MACLHSLCLAQPIPAWPSGENYRRSGNDAANSLYIMSCLNGQRVRYDDSLGALGRSGHPTSLVDLRDAARHVGLQAVLYKCSIEDLAVLRAPFVAHLESNGVGTGSFVVLVRINKDHSVYAIDAGTLMTLQLSGDDFRRQWSGYVLACVASPRTWPMLLFAVLTASSGLKRRGVCSASQDRTSCLTET